MTESNIAQWYAHEEALPKLIKSSAKAGGLTEPSR